MHYQEWMNNFLTEEGACYTAWDEIQADQLGTYPTHEEAVEALYSHGELIAEEYEKEGINHAKR
jgi:hypothetical protein